MSRGTIGFHLRKVHRGHEGKANRYVLLNSKRQDILIVLTPTDALGQIAG